MEQEGLKQKDLISIVGSKSRVSEILNKKRKLTLDMIRKLHTQLYILITALTYGAMLISHDRILLKRLPYEYPQK